MSKQPTESDYARNWLQQRLHDLQTEMAVMHGRAEEIARLIGELDKDVRPPILAPTESPVRTRQPKFSTRREKKGTNANLRRHIIATLRSAGAKGMRLSNLRDAMTAQGISWPSNFLSIVLHEEKVLGNIEHNPKTGRHRWVGGRTLPPKKETPRQGSRLGYIGPHRQMVRDVLAHSHGGMTNQSIRLACEAKGTSMTNNLIGAILSVERKAGHVTFDEPTGSYHWIEGAEQLEQPEAVES